MVITGQYEYFLMYLQKQSLEVKGVAFLYAELIDSNEVNGGQKREL